MIGELAQTGGPDRRAASLSSQLKKGASKLAQNDLAVDLLQNPNKARSAGDLTRF